MFYLLFFFSVSHQIFLFFGITTMAYSNIFAPIHQMLYFPLLYVSTPYFTTLSHTSMHSVFQCSDSWIIASIFLLHLFVIYKYIIASITWSVNLFFSQFLEFFFLKLSFRTFETIFLYLYQNNFFVINLNFLI